MWQSTIQTGSSLCSFNSLWSRQFTAPSFIVPRCRDIAAVLRRHSKLNTLLRLSLLTFKSLGREAGLYFCLSLSSKDYKVRGAHIKQQSNPWRALRRALLTPEQHKENTALTVWNCWLIPGSKNQGVRFAGIEWQKKEKQIRISAFGYKKSPNKVVCDKLVICPGCNPAFTQWLLGWAPVNPHDPESRRRGCRKWNEIPK